MVSIQAILVGVASALASVHALSPDWVSINTECSEVTYDGKTLCVSNNYGGILCSTSEYEGTPSWNYHSGNVVGARVWGEHVWAVSADGDVQVRTTADNADWHTLPSSLKFKHVSVDGKQICAISVANDIYCADDEIMTNPNWRKLPGKFTQLDLTDGIIYAVTEDSRLHYGVSDGETAWKEIPGTFKQVAYDGGVLCGITPVNALLCATAGLPTAPQYEHYEGEFTFVEVQAGRVYAVEASTMTFMRWISKPPVTMDRDWKALKSQPKLRQINFDGKTLVGVASDEGVWAATSGFDDSPNWFQIDGMLKHVVVWGDRIYGVNGEGTVWTAHPSTTPQWKQLPGTYNQISTDGKQLCGVNAHSEVWCADRTIDSEPNWRRIDGNFQHVVVLNGVLMATSAGDNSVWVGRAEGEPKWHKIPDLHLRNLEYDGINLCGTNSDGEIYCADSGFVEGTPNMEKLEGKAVYTAVNSGRVFAVTADYQLYTRNDQ